MLEFFYFNTKLKEKISALIFVVVVVHCIIFGVFSLRFSQCGEELHFLA